MKEDDPLAQAEKALRACLADVRFIEVESVRRAGRRRGAPDRLIPEPDLRVRTTGTAGGRLLVVEVKSSGEPRFARDAVNQLLQIKHRFAAEDPYPVFAAPYISDRGADICREAGVGYVDFAGNCLLDFGTVHVQRKGADNPFKRAGDLRSLYARKATRVLRIMLLDPKRSWRLQELADEADVSLGHVHKVKRALEAAEWVASDRDGLRLTEPRELLDAWASEYSFRKNEARDFYSMERPAKTEAALSSYCRESGIRCALTGFSGANLVAPMVRSDRVMAYVERGPEAAARSLDLKPVTSGANVTLLKPYDEGVFDGLEWVHGDVPVVSPIQLYLDLVSFKGRGEEAAAEVLRKAIEPTW